MTSLLERIGRKIRERRREKQWRRLQQPSFTRNEWERYSGAYEEAYREGLPQDLVPQWEAAVDEAARKIQVYGRDDPHGGTQEQWEAFSHGLAIIHVHDTFPFLHEVDLWTDIGDKLTAEFPGIVNRDNPPMIRLPSHPNDFKMG
ncbi:hypothetical protein HY409_01700 [Candidatus Gottesmanbacteria bacterium]|nr:hypothetical protein [Candidatus Gottesmanbacteria bacterium]